MSVRSVFPRRVVFQSATPADRRTSRRSSSVVRARACVRACRHGVVKCAASSDRPCAVFVCSIAALSSQRAVAVVSGESSNEDDGDWPAVHEGERGFRKKNIVFCCKTTKHKYSRLSPATSLVL